MGTQDNLRVTYCQPKPPSEGLHSAIPQMAQHSVHIAPRQLPNITLPCRNAETSP